jgi:hypothetical protein
MMQRLLMLALPLTLAGGIGLAYAEESTGDQSDGVQQESTTDQPASMSDDSSCDQDQGGCTKEEEQKEDSGDK